MNFNKIFGIVAIATIPFSRMYAQKKNKLSLSMTTSKNVDYGRLNGLEFEYLKNFNKHFAGSTNIEFGRANSFPKFTNGGTTSDVSTNSETISYIYENVRTTGFLWGKINQQIYSVNGYYLPLNNEKNSIYISNGIGLNIQDALDYGIGSTKTLIYADGTSSLKEFTDYYSQRGANTLVYLFGVGYDYKFNSNWHIGLNVRGQLPLTKNQNFYKYGGAGFDEILRFSIKIGREF
jgi:hypothetical protein